MSGHSSIHSNTTNSSFPGSLIPCAQPSPATTWILNFCHFPAPSTCNSLGPPKEIHYLPPILKIKDQFSHQQVNELLCYPMGYIVPFQTGMASVGGNFPYNLPILGIILSTLGYHIQFSQILQLLFYQATILLILYLTTV